MNELYVIALVNACLCAVCGMVFICRINSMETSGPKITRIIVQTEYAIGVTAMLVSALRPLWHEYPGYASLAVHVYILTHLLASAPAWHHHGYDEPPESATVPGEFTS